MLIGYTRNRMNMSPWKLKEELNASAIVPVCETVVNSEALTNNLMIHFDAALSGAEETIMDDTITTHVSLDLQEYIKAKNLTIDIRTGQLIAAGFSFDSQTFSLSIYAQKNWAQLKNDHNDGTLVAEDFPFSVTTINDTEYDITEDDIQAFYDTGFAVIKGHLDSGRALKLQVNPCVDEPAVDAIIDTR